MKKPTKAQLDARAAFRMNSLNLKREAARERYFARWGQYPLEGQWTLADIDWKKAA